MCTNIRIAVTGHSFVRHLLLFIDNDEDNLDRYNRGFNLYRENCETEFIYKSGCNIPQFVSHLEAQVIKMLPHIIIIELGTNDLSNPSVTPSKLADQLLRMSKALLKGVTKFVIISGIINRSVTKSSIEPDAFNGKVKLYNRLMMQLCQDEPYLIFMPHSRILRGNNVLKADGIHLNDRGNYLLYMSYKNSLAHAIHHINRMEGCSCNTSVTVKKGKRTNPEEDLQQ